MYVPHPHPTLVPCCKERLRHYICPEPCIPWAPVSRRGCNSYNTMYVPHPGPCRNERLRQLQHDICAPPWSASQVKAATVATLYTSPTLGHVPRRTATVATPVMSPTLAGPCCKESLQQLWHLLPFQLLVVTVPVSSISIIHPILGNDLLALGHCHFWWYYFWNNVLRRMFLAPLPSCQWYAHSSYS